MLSSKKDVEIVNLDNLSAGSNPANLRDVKNDDRYTFIRGSITDFSLVSELVKDMDAIVNFAAMTHVDRSIANPKLFFDNNAYGTFNLLEASRNSRAKFVQVSTDEIYGDIVDGSFKEGNTLRPSNPYSASKAAADMFVLSYFRTYGLDAIITRCTNNFGPYQHPEKFIPKTIIKVCLNLKVPIYGSGKNIRDWIYMLDHCEGLDIVLQSGDPGEIYNISGGNELENLEVVKKVLKHMEKDESLIEFVEDRPGHDVRYSLDPSKIRNDLGWKPRHSFDEALKLTVEWYLKNEQWWRPMVSYEVLHPTPWILR